MYKIIRFVDTKEGVFGALLYNNKPVCVTLEDSWLNNKNNISCIPEGAYQVVKHFGQKYKDVWRLENVKGRSGILIHWGNTDFDTEGCILVGEKFGTLYGKPAILHSMAAIRALRKVLPDQFLLNIENKF